MASRTFFETCAVTTDLDSHRNWCLSNGQSIRLRTDGFIVSGLVLPDRSHSFVFDYTGSEQLVVEILTLDSEEFAEVHMPGDEQWQLVSGSTPDVSASAAQRSQVPRRRHGIWDPGVSNFIVYSSDPVSTVTVTLGSLNFDKHEFVRIGKSFPNRAHFRCWDWPCWEWSVGFAASRTSGKIAARPLTSPSGIKVTAAVLWHRRFFVGLGLSQQDSNPLLRRSWAGLQQERLEANSIRGLVDLGKKFPTPLTRRKRSDIS